MPRTRFGQDLDADADVAEVERIVEGAHGVMPIFRDLQHLGQLVHVACSAEVHVSGNSSSA